jgi:hypothetical protein
MRAIFVGWLIAAHAILPPPFIMINLIPQRSFSSLCHKWFVIGCLKMTLIIL